MTVKRIWVGIDVGTKTGFAVWDSKEKRFILLKTVLIHEAMQLVRDLRDQWGDELFVIFEDARKQKMVGYSRVIQLSRAQGAGSVKRDSKIWEDYLLYLKVDFDARKPFGTKKDKKLFELLTGISTRTSSHARDAAILVLNK